MSGVFLPEPKQLISHAPDFAKSSAFITPLGNETSFIFLYLPDFQSLEELVFLRSVPIGLFFSLQYIFFASNVMSEPL